MKYKQFSSETKEVICSSVGSGAKFSYTSDLRISRASSDFFSILVKSSTRSSGWAEIARKRILSYGAPPIPININGINISGFEVAHDVCTLMLWHAGGNTVNMFYPREGYEEILQVEVALRKRLDELATEGAFPGSVYQSALYAIDHTLGFSKKKKERIQTYPPVLDTIAGEIDNEEAVLPEPPAEVVEGITWDEANNILNVRSGERNVSTGRVSAPQAGRMERSEGGGFEFVASVPRQTPRWTTNTSTSTDSPRPEPVPDRFGEQLAQAREMAVSELGEDAPMSDLVNLTSEILDEIRQLESEE